MIKIGIVFSLAVMLLINGCAASKEERIGPIKSKYPQWDQTTVENVAGRQVTVGMTEEMVLMAMGKPWRISGDGEIVIWGYGRLEGCRDWGTCERMVYFIHFHDKKVTSTHGDKRKLGFQYF